MTELTTAIGGKPRQARTIVATIDKGNGAQLRIFISEWRGARKLELADFTAIVAGVYSQAGAGITIPIEKLPELLQAIAAAEREAIARGLL